jgi:hypothetical protein
METRSDEAEFLRDLRKEVSSALKQGNHSLSTSELNGFMNAVRGSIERFRRMRERAPSVSEDRRELRRIFKLADGPDPPIGLIRKGLQQLGPAARSYLQRRADRLPAREPGVPANDPDIFVWFAKAPPERLVASVKQLIREGSVRIEGRKREGDKRSAPTMEAEIMGVTKGDGSSRNEGGRPSNEAEGELVMHLALDWASATGEIPDRKRTDHFGFAGLVHRIFRLLGLGSAETALRTYWSAVADKGRRPERKKKAAEPKIDRGPAEGNQGQA